MIAVRPITFERLLPSVNTHVVAKVVPLPEKLIAVSVFALVDLSVTIGPRIHIFENFKVTGGWNLFLIVNFRHIKSFPLSIVDKGPFRNLVTHLLTLNIFPFDLDRRSYRYVEHASLFNKHRTTLICINIVTLHCSLVKSSFNWQKM